MTFRFSLLSASLCAIAPFSAAAEGIEHLSYGATYTNLSVDGDSVGILDGSVAIDYRQGDFLVAGNLKLVDVSAVAAVNDYRVTEFTARLGYFVMPDLVVYGGINSTNPSDASSLTSYNLGTEYTSGAITVGLNYDDSSEAGYNETITAYGSYRIGGSIELGLGLSDTNGTTLTTVRGEYEAETYSFVAAFSEANGAKTFGMTGAYEFADGYRAKASYFHLDDNFDRVDVFSVGAGYEVSDNLWADLSVGQMNDGALKIDTISLGLTYKMGKNTLLVDRAIRVQDEVYGVLGSF